MSCGPCANIYTAFCLIGVPAMRIIAASAKFRPGREMKKAANGSLFVISACGLLFPQNVADFVILFATQQDTCEDIVNLSAVGVRKANHHFGEEVRV